MAHGLMQSHGAMHLAKISAYATCIIMPFNQKRTIVWLKCVQQVTLSNSIIHVMFEDMLYKFHINSTVGCMQVESCTSSVLFEEVSSTQYCMHNSTTCMPIVCTLNPTNPRNGLSCRLEMQAPPLQIILERSIKITYPFQFETTSQLLQLTKLWERRIREKRRASSLQITSLWDWTTFSGLKGFLNFFFIVSSRLDAMANWLQTSIYQA